MFTIILLTKNNNNPAINVLLGLRPMWFPTNPTKKSHQFSPRRRCHGCDRRSEAFANQPLLQFGIKVTFDLQGHGHLVDLSGQLLAGHFLQELPDVLLQGPYVPLHFPYERGLAVAERQVRVHGHVVHAGAADHVGQRRRGLRRGTPAGRGAPAVFRRGGHLRRRDEPLHKLVLGRSFDEGHLPVARSGGAD